MASIIELERAGHRVWQLSSRSLGSMSEHGSPSPDERDLTTEEMRLVLWLLEHGAPEARDYLSSIEGLRVVSRCQCGCPSVNFEAYGGEGMKVLADFQYTDPVGHAIGVYLFASSRGLAGIDVWSVEGYSVPTSLPDPSRETLRALG